MNVKRITALGLTGALTVSLLTGCGVNKNATIATMGDQKISMGVANFLCRYQQASYDDMFMSWMGEGYWSEDLYGTGSTTEDDVKSSAMEKLHEFYTLQNHMSDYGVELTDDQKAAITEAAASFMESNSKQAIKEMGATQEIVEEVLTLYTIQSLMHEAIIADADTEVTDEEANMRGYTYIEIDTTTDSDGNTLTDDQVEEYGVMAGLMLTQILTESESTEEPESADADSEDADSEATESTDADSEEDTDVMSTVAENYGYSAIYATYDEDNDTLDDEVRTALDSMEPGDDPQMVSTDSAIYILRLDTDCDEDATENNINVIISDRQDTLYDDTLSGWQEDDGWTVKEKQLAKIKFSNYFTTTAETESTEEAETTED